MNFLKYKIFENCVSPTLNRSAAIQRYQTPKNIREISRLLGITNYDRAFILRLSKTAKPPYEIIEKKFPKWTKKTSIFWNKQSKVVQWIEIAIPNRKERFTLETDASYIGLGAALRQNNEPVA